MMDALTPNPSPLSQDALTLDPSPIGWARGSGGWARGTGRGVIAISHQLTLDEFIRREEPELERQAVPGIFWVEPRVGNAGFGQFGFEKSPVFRSGQFFDGQHRLDQRGGEL